MSDRPQVSVIIPTYRRPKECLRAVKSVLLQTFQDYEIIVGDDYGMDETKALLDELGDPRIRYFDNQGKGGSASSNRNLCLERSLGRYITFLDSDDFILPDKLQFQYDALNDSDLEVGFVISGTRVVKVQGGKYYRFKDLIPTAEGDIREAYFNRRLRCYNTSLMVRRGVLSAIGNWDYNMEPYDDAELIYRLMGHTRAVRVVDLLTVWFDHDGECLTNDLQMRMTGLEAFMRKHESELEQHTQWWGPRVEELLNWFYLGGDLVGFRRWESKLESPVSRRIRFLRWLARFPVMFMLTRRIHDLLNRLRGLCVRPTHSKNLLDLVPEPHREVMATIL